MQDAGKDFRDGKEQGIAIPANARNESRQIHADAFPVMEFVLRTEADSQRLWAALKGWQGFAKDGKPLTVTVNAHEAKQRDSQRIAYWVMLGDIAEQYEVEGRRYDAKYWHEFFKQRLIGGISTKALNATGMTKFMADVYNFATDLGVIITDKGF
jgi:hypothetical protein